VYYFSQGKRITLKPAEDDVMVKYRSRAGMMAEKGVEVFSMRNNIALLRALGAQARAVLEESSDVLYTSQVYEVPNGWLAATNEIIVKFDTSLTENDIQRINDFYGATPKKKLLDGSYLLQLKVKKGEEAIAIANEYHRLNDTVFAHPNFLRHMRLRPETPSSAEMELGIQLPYDPDPPRSEQAGSIRTLAAGSKNLETILNDKFDGDFYGTWTVLDNDGPTNGEAYWGKTKKKYKSPPKSVWCADGGPDRAQPGEEYPNGMDSWMVYGPFSLEDANYAEVTFRTWLKSEAFFDKLRWFASIDGSSFVGYSASGNWASSYGWIRPKLVLTDLPDLGDITGQPQVWFALNFKSDDSITSKGAYVDNLKITQFTDPLVAISNDPYSSRQWSLNNIGQNGGAVDADLDVPDAWSTTTGDNSVTVAVIDEGVDLAHPDLLANLVAGYDATDQPSGDTAGGPEPGSDDAHGTACAGIIAAVSDNDEGIAGIAPGVRIMPVRIAYSSGLGGWLTTDAWISDGINWAWMNGADVLSNSWGGGTPSDTITNAITDARKQGRGGLGSVILFASGNDDSSVSYPATLSAVEAVGASSPCDERKGPDSCDGEFYWGSNYGSELDIVAPGVQIPTTDISGPDGYSTGDYTMDFNGTSAACPHAAGVVALMLSANSNLTKSEVRNLLRESADDVSPDGKDEFTGHGRVNARRAVIKAIRALN
jgi:subtilisin family serine protease